MNRSTLTASCLVGRMIEAVIDRFVISKVGQVMGRADGRMLKETIHELGVSRPTAIRWLRSMERDGLLYRTYAMKEGKRGRPKGVYHATKSLKRFMEDPQNGNQSVVNLRFETVKEMCKHQTGGMCKFFVPKIQRCEAWGCPYAKSH